MKLFNKIAMLFLAGVAFTACTEDNEWIQAVDKNDATYSGVSFPERSMSLELLPEDPTTTTIRLARENTEKAEIVPLEILVNTDSVFEVGECAFAEGEEVAEVAIDFSKAEIGKKYTLKLALGDTKYTDEYTAANTMTVSVVRAKWVPIEGKGKLYAGIINGRNESIDIEMRSDDSTQFRIVDPFASMILTVEGKDILNSEMEGYTGADKYLYFRVLKVDEKLVGSTITRRNLVYFDDVRIGRNDFLFGYKQADVSFLHPCYFSDYDKEENWLKNCVVEWLEEPKGDTPGLPGKVQLAPFYFLEGLGGIDFSQDNGGILIYFPGYEEPQLADIFEDFEWEPVLTAEFISEQMGTSKRTTLHKGKFVRTDADGVLDAYADSIFKVDWGTPYLLESPYAEHYHLIFTVDKDGYIMVPDEVAMQPIGIDAMNEPIYARINANNSSFSEKQVILNITFTNESGTKVYGTTDERFEDITYTPVGTADFTYHVLFGDENDNPVTQSDMLVEKRDDMEDRYVIRGWGGGEIDFFFNWDKKTNQITVPAQQLDEEVAFIDFYSYSKEDPKCVYHPETTTADFYLLYVIGEKGYVDLKMPETAKFNFSSDAAMRAKKSKAARNLKKADIRKAPVFGRVKNVGRNPWAHYKTVSTAKKAFEPVKPLIFK